MKINTFEYDSANSKYGLVFHFIYHDYPTMHKHDYWEFPIVMSGSVRHIINSKSHIFEPNIACLIRPNDCHMLVNSTENMSLLNILIKDEYMRKFCSFYSDSLYDTLVNSPEITLKLTKEQVAEFLFDSYQLFENESDEEHYKLLATLAINSILIKVVRLHLKNDEPAQLVRPKWLSTILEKAMLFENRAWKTKDMVNESGYCHSHFCREFAKHMKCTPIQYLTKIKMMHACNYLSYSDKTIFTISQDLGYSTPSHFNAMFHSVYNMSPSQYRKKTKKD